VAENPPDQAAIYFPETGHWMAGQFVKFWEEQGGLNQFGYPIAEPQMQGTLLIQWFERARFELDLQATNPQVMLGLLGKEVLTASSQEPSNTEEKNPILSLKSLMLNIVIQIKDAVSVQSDTEKLR
jgi:hypothetical protein